MTEEAILNPERSSATANPVSRERLLDGIYVPSSFPKDAEGGIWDGKNKPELLAQIEIPVQQAAQSPFKSLEAARNALWYEEMRQKYGLPANATKEQVNKAIGDVRWANEDQIIRARNGGVLPKGDGRVGDALYKARNEIWYEEMRQQYGLPVNATKEQVGQAIGDVRWANTDQEIRLRNNGRLPPRENQNGNGQLANLLDLDPHHILSQFYSKDHEKKSENKNLKAWQTWLSLQQEIDPMVM